MASRSEAVETLLKNCLTFNKNPKRSSSMQQLRPSVTQLQALYALERVSGFGPVKFRALHEAGIEPGALIKDPNSLPVKGRIGQKLRDAIQSISANDLSSARSRAFTQLERANELSASILTYREPGYPTNVYRSNNPIPVLYVRGDPKIWWMPGAVSVVGSRNTREPYASAAREFATTAVGCGLAVVSGFALGADSIGHRATVAAGGRTVCVMPCGLDKVFPPENRGFWEELLIDPNAVFVSEFGFGHRASSLLLRKRNKLIVSFSQAVLVAQSAANGGAMNAYRFGREQRKPVATFKSDGSEETTGNEIIEADERTGGFAFPLSACPSSFGSWLKRLSS